MQPQKALSTVSGGTLNDQTTKTTSCDKTNSRPCTRNFDWQNRLNISDVHNWRRNRRYSVNAEHQAILAYRPAVRTWRSGFGRCRCGALLRYSENKRWIRQWGIQWIWHCSTCNPPYKRTVSRFNRNCRYLSLRVHFARSLRCYRTRLYRQRQDFTAFSKSVGGLCKSRCGYCCTVGYDGRTSRCNTSGTWRKPLWGRTYNGIQRQIFIIILRTVPRRSWQCSVVWGQKKLSNGFQK